MLEHPSAGGLPQDIELQPLIEELVHAGASVVYLAGSRARGDAGPHSDIDLGALSQTPPRIARTFRVHRDVLTSVVWSSPAAARKSFEDPAVLGAAVPGWRNAALLYDPQGVGADIVSAAHSWSWEAVSESCDAWAARAFTQLGEEVHKLCNALAAGDREMAASRRNLLASRLPLVISVRRRILYDTERALWPLVSREMGAAYASNQRAALGVEDQTFAESVHGALAMYSLAHEQCRDVLDPEQAQVADASLSLIRGYAAP